MSTPPRAHYDPRQGDPTIARPWLRWLIVGCGALMVGGIAITAIVMAVLGIGM